MHILGGHCQHLAQVLLRARQTTVTVALTVNAPPHCISNLSLSCSEGARTSRVLGTICIKPPEVNHGSTELQVLKVLSY